MELALTSSYPSPVNQLLTYGETGSLSPDQWPNYLELGLSSEHIPDLIRMVSDEQLNDADVEHVEGWAPMHAYRALGQLHAEIAVEPLLSSMELFQEVNEFAMEELPNVFAMIGPVALPKTAEYIADPSHNEWARIGAIQCIEEIGLAWPEVRSECIALLMAQLELFVENDYDINAFLIKALVKLQAVEALPLIEQAFAADRVEEFVLGDWDDVQVKFGLKSAEEVEEKRARERKERWERYERERSEDEGEHPYFSARFSSRTSHKSEEGRRKKARSKMVKQSRKKNRKR